MEKKLTHSKWFLYLTEFFAGMSVMAVGTGRQPPDGAVFQLISNRLDGHYRRYNDRYGCGQHLGRTDG